MNASPEKPAVGVKDGASRQQPGSELSAPHRIASSTLRALRAQLRSRVTRGLRQRPSVFNRLCSSKAPREVALVLGATTCAARFSTQRGRAPPVRGLTPRSSAEPQRRASRPAVQCSSSSVPRACRPTAGPGLARTLGVTRHLALWTKRRFTRLCVSRRNPAARSS